MDANEEPSTKQVKSARTVFSVIEAVYQLDGGGVSEIATRLGMAKSSIHAHLNTLESCEYLVREGDQYHVSLKFLELGEFAKSRKTEYKISQRKVRELAEETEERSQFIVEEHGRGVYVHREVGERGVHTDPGIGKRIPLHSTAAGKAILAELPTDRVESVLDTWGLESVTDNSITDAESLYDELDGIRERGYAFNLEENVPGLNAVGVAVTGSDGRVCGALSVSGPSHRLEGSLLYEEIPNLLLGTANELELNLMYS
ncbi:MAG: IclR family transcriptional regulator [Halobacteriota archaeon]|uniref:IclR family transcriptional regulator n=1 Tax=Natronomonas sp. TaxID=2184060 RepID=UPI003974C047